VQFLDEIIESLLVGAVQDLGAVKAVLAADRSDEWTLGKPGDIIRYLRPLRIDDGGVDLGNMASSSTQRITLLCAVTLVF
jgi:hypothetical protein